MSVLQGRPGHYWADCYAVCVHVDHDPARGMWVAHIGASILATGHHLEDISGQLEEISPEEVARAVAAAATPRPRPGGDH